MTKKDNLIRAKIIKGLEITHKKLIQSSYQADCLYRAKRESILRHRMQGSHVQQFTTSDFLLSGLLKFMPHLKPLYPMPILPGRHELTKLLKD
jgi:hypothetical protein